MMNSQDFRKNAHHLVDWMADYFENIEQYPVKSPVQPREVYQKIPEHPPQESEEFARIFQDFQDIIMPGITHWQHPAFHAYFPANNSFPSVLGEMLMSTLGAQCMIWETSPAAAELEEKMMEWLKEMMHLPAQWTGVIQDTASTATLCALLTARELASEYTINQCGFSETKYRVYASNQTHSSIDKAVRIAGLGLDNLVKIEVDKNFALIPEALEKAIQTDLEQGYQPLCVIATLGSTSSTAVDPIRRMGEISQQYGIFYHIDAAYLGTAGLLPECQPFFDGLELADSYLFNPHKWMMVNFDCTAYFVKDSEALVKTFEILPEYLKTRPDAVVNNYRDWGVPLGRRFRALKLWMVIRDYGLKGLQDKIRQDLVLAQSFKKALLTRNGFEIMAPVEFNLICFRYHPAENLSLAELNDFNQKLLESINQSAKAYLTHTKLNGKYVLRVVFGQTFVSEKQVNELLLLLDHFIQLD